MPRRGKSVPFLVEKSPLFVREFQHWTEADPKKALKIIELVNAVEADPFRGIGQPEPLKRTGLWSRRIDKMNRLVYRVDAGVIRFHTCRGHYE